MFFLDRLDLDRRFRLLRQELRERGIDEELRVGATIAPLFNPSPHPSPSELESWPPATALP